MCDPSLSALVQGWATKSRPWIGGRVVAVETRGLLGHTPQPGCETEPSPRRAVRDARTRLRSNFGATTPKHQAEPGTIRDQKTKPGTTKNDPVRSAKPPSPVQIRAAPPFFRRNSRDSAGACLAGHSLLLRRALDSLLGFVGRPPQVIGPRRVVREHSEQYGGVENLFLNRWQT